MFQPTNTRRLSIGTLNVNRLCRDEQLVGLQEELQGINIDVLALTELRWKGEGALDLNDSGFRFYHAGPEDGQDVSGTGFFVSSRVQPFVESFRRVSPRISVLDLKYGRQLLRLFAVYAPPTSSTRSVRSSEDNDAEEEDEEEEYEGCLETIRRELRTVRMPGWERGSGGAGRDAIVQLRVYPVLLGDFNAKIGR
uniref:Endo/exonuclease/phosphatase domain-containing protein n=1 Tax=Steinernema glaseri TaxID=37863 RepID=A0A1I7YZI0_9BILA